MTIEFVDLPMKFSHGGSFHSYGKLPDLQRVAMADLIGAWLSRPGKHRKNDGKIHHHHAIHGKIHELSMMIFQFVMLNYQRVSPNLWALQVFLYSHPQKRWNVGLVMTLWKTPAAVPMNHKKPHLTSGFPILCQLNANFAPSILYIFVLVMSCLYDHHPFLLLKTISLYACDTCHPIVCLWRLWQLHRNSYEKITVSRRSGSCTPLFFFMAIFHPVISHAATWSYPICDMGLSENKVSRLWWCIMSFPINTAIKMWVYPIFLDKSIWQYIWSNLKESRFNDFLQHFPLYPMILPGYRSEFGNFSPKGIVPWVFLTHTRLNICQLNYPIPIPVHPHSPMIYRNDTSWYTDNLA